jgi:cytochrome bd-type quinol oxidase subunit 1
LGILCRRDGRLVSADAKLSGRVSNHASRLFLAVALVPLQFLFGHLVGDYVHKYQPAKFAAIEARWHDEQPASEVLIAIPDAAAETNR